MTKNLKDDGVVRRLVGAAKQKFRLEIRKATNTELHDRYIASKTEMVILGTSLNGFGKKQCFVIKAGPGIKDAMTGEFDARWLLATPWP